MAPTTPFPTVSPTPSPLRQSWSPPLSDIDEERGDEGDDEESGDEGDDEESRSSDEAMEEDGSDDEESGGGSHDEEGPRKKPRYE
jgi:hypothetical protein